MKKNLFVLIFFFFLHNIGYASNKENLIIKLRSIDNMNFNFIQTIDGKDEKGQCVIQYPKKIFCEYEKRNNKILWHLLYLQNNILTNISIYTNITSV